jgi:TPR repeat protein
MKKTLVVFPFSRFQRGVYCILILTISTLASSSARTQTGNYQADQLWQRADTLLQAGRVAEALPVLMQSAKLGNARAQTTLGNMYGDGRGVPKDFKQAMYWYEKGAEQGHRFSQYSLGLGYMIGLGGLPTNDAQAARLFEASAKQGLSDAQTELGVAYEFGFGVPRNRQTAIAWLNQAAQQGDGRAHWIADWLRRPDTPQFKDMVQLDNYINAVVIRTNTAKALAGGDQNYRDYVQRGLEGRSMANPQAAAACLAKTSGAHC